MFIVFYISWASSKSCAVCHVGEVHEHKLIIILISFITLNAQKHVIFLFVFLFEHESATKTNLWRTQICQSLSYDRVFSKDKVSVPTLRYFLCNMKISIAPPLWASLDPSVLVHYINQTLLLSLKKSLGLCIFIMNFLEWCGYGRQKIQPQVINLVRSCSPLHGKEAN